MLDRAIFLYVFSFSSFTSCHCPLSKRVKIMLRPMSVYTQDTSSSKSACEPLRLPCHRRCKTLANDCHSKGGLSALKCSSKNKGYPELTCAEQKVCESVWFQKTLCARVCVCACMCLQRLEAGIGVCVPSPALACTCRG